VARIARTTSHAATAIGDGVLAGLAIVCGWAAAVVTALSLAGLALMAFGGADQFASGFGPREILLGWAFTSGILSLVALGLGRLARS
jgi:hypothetical protein